MRSKRKATNFPVRWQPYAELTAVACGAGRRDAIVERNLLSQLKGDAAKVQQATDDRPRPEPSLALSLRVGSQEEPPQQQQNRLRYASTRQSPSLLPAGSGGVPVPTTQTYTPGSSPAAGEGLAPPPPPPPQLGSNSLQLPLVVGPTPPEPRCGACSLRYDRLAAELLRRVGDDLDRRVGLLRQELSAEVRMEVLRLHAAAAAAGVPLPLPLPLPAAAFSAGVPQPGAWRRCPACGARPGTVALKPYEHLCLCAQCSDASRVCLHCCSFTWTGAVVEAASRGRGRGRGGALPSWP